MCIRDRVWDTKHNNGVLIYLLLAERAIELIADRGINASVSAKQWSDFAITLGNTLTCLLYTSRCV